MTNDLHPILWRGRQWAVTTYGVECLLAGHFYPIETKRLRAHEPEWSWLLQLAEKEWVELKTSSRPGSSLWLHGRTQPADAGAIREIVENARDIAADVATDIKQQQGVGGFSFTSFNDPV